MQRFRKLAVLMLVFVLISGTIKVNAGQSPAKNGPILNHGSKWRIGFCQSEPYQDYASNFYYIIKGLEEAGWVSGINGLPFKKGKTILLQCGSG